MRTLTAFAAAFGLAFAPVLAAAQVRVGVSAEAASSPASSALSRSSVSRGALPGVGSALAPLIASPGAPSAPLPVMFPARAAAEAAPVAAPAGTNPS